MICGGCGNTSAFRLKKYGDGAEYCNACGNVGMPYLPDVYWDGKPEHGLADGPDGKPLVFGSKREKADYLVAKGLKEAGDKTRGSYSLPRSEEIGVRGMSGREALLHVKQMGRDVKRQAYLRIVKEGR